MATEDPPRRVIPTFQATCPDDGAQLEVQSGPSGALGVALGSPAFRKCPKCGGKFSSSTMQDALSSISVGRLGDIVANMQPNVLSNMNRYLAASNSGQITLPQLDTAAREQSDIKKQLDLMRQRLDELQRERPEQRSDEDLEELRQGLSGVDERVEALGKSPEDAKTTLLHLVPAPEDLAALRVMRAELTDLRRLVDQHVNEDRTRRADEDVRAERGQSRRLAIYIAFATVAGGLIGSAITAIAGRP